MHNALVETVKSDTNDGSKLDEKDDGECNTGNFSSNDDDDDGPVSPCHIGDLMSQIKWHSEVMQAGFVDESAVGQVETIPEWTEDSMIHSNAYRNVDWATLLWLGLQPAPMIMQESLVCGM